MNIIAMIPARMGSQRLLKKNTRLLNDVPLVVHAIRKCQEAQCFSKIYLNTEDQELKKFAVSEGIDYYHRKQELADHDATSEDYLFDFLLNVECDVLVQVHSIAPLLSANEITDFTKHFSESEYDMLVSCVEDQIEVAFQNKPINFSFGRKNNSQDLLPTQRITWSISAWRRNTFLEAKARGSCATYAGNIGFFPVNKLAAHVIKTEFDLRIAEALMSLGKI
jgi:CMP-N-acetylneuraminic acid synthetase